MRSQEPKSIMKKLKQVSLIEWILLFIFVVRIILTAYYNLKLLENHMGYDSSWSYLKAALMWKEKAFVSNVWTDQTSVFWDSPMLLAALIYGITDKLFISYGMSNLIILSGTIMLLYRITCLMCFDRKNQLLCINLALCPYMVNGFGIENDLGYFNDFISGPAFYSLRVLIFLLVIYNFLLLKKGRTSKVGVTVSMILCFLAGMSSGIFMIVMIIIPCMAFLVERCLIENGFGVWKKKEALYTYCCLICIYGGKIFAEKVLNIVAIDTSRSWTTIEKIWINFGAVVQGLMKLMGILPVYDTSVEILSIEGIYRLFPMAIFAVALIAVVFCIRNITRRVFECDENMLFFTNILLCQILLFGLFNAQYGSAIFEERYLICLFLDIILLIGFFVSSLPQKYNVTYLIWLFLIGGLCGTNAVSDFKYITTTNASWELLNIAEVVQQSDAKVVYVWGDTISALGRSMRAFDLEHIYKCIPTAGGGYHHWGDYVYYDQNEEYDGSTLLIAPNNVEVSSIPQYIMDQYIKLEELSCVSVFYSDKNPMDFTAGITNDISVDYPYTEGVIVQNGTYERGDFLTDGTGGFVMCGPSADTREGTYDFIVSYEIVEEGIQDAVFDVVIDQGTTSLGAISLVADRTEATIEDIKLEGGHKFEYRIKCEEGTIIKIKEILIKKVTE